MNTITKTESKVRFGLITRAGSRRGSRVAMCNCGQYVLEHAERDFQCDLCGNEYFVDIRNRNYGERFTIPVLDILRSDNRGFKVIRANVSVRLGEDKMSFEVIKDNLKRTLDYDMVEKYLRVYRNDELEFEWTEAGGYNAVLRDMTATNSLFFRSIEYSNFASLVGNEVTTDLYMSMARRSENHRSPFFEKLIYLATKPYLQILANAGVPNPCRFDIFHRGYGNSSPSVNQDKTKPHEILGVPKFMMEYIRKDTGIEYYMLRDIHSALAKIEGNKFKELLSISYDEASLTTLMRNLDRIMTLHNEYDYKNLKKLILFLFRETKMYQGMEAYTACQHLLDYNRINKEMGLPIEDKYPRSLKREHDVASMNHRVQMDKIQAEKFKNKVETDEYKNLKYKSNGYIIVPPAEAQDLIREGNELSHCVGSYVKQVIEGNCKIVFLRNIDDPDTPLATIEVRGVNIRQARGRHNRAISESAKVFIRKWADKKGLHVAYY